MRVAGIVDKPGNRSLTLAAQKQIFIGSDVPKGHSGFSSDRPFAREAYCLLFTALPIGKAAGSWGRAGGIQLLLQIPDVDLD